MSYRNTMIMAFLVNASVPFIYIFSNGDIGRHFVLFNPAGVGFILLIGFFFLYLGLSGNTNPLALLFCATEKLVYSLAWLWFISFHSTLLSQIYTENLVAFLCLAGFGIVDGTFMVLFTRFFWQFRRFSKATLKSNQVS